MLASRGWWRMTARASRNEAVGGRTGNVRKAIFALAATVAIAAGLGGAAEAAVFHCGSGDTACLIAAINTANANGSASTIILEAGTYALSAVDNTTEGPNGLPVITSPLTIIGADQNSTMIQRAATAPPFRLVYVGQTGVAMLEALTLTNGSIPPPNDGGGVINHGSLALNHVAVTGNTGGGISNSGTSVIARSTIAANTMAQAGYPVFWGGLYNGRTATVINSMIVDNTTRSQAASQGGGVLSSGFLWVWNSTIARNQADSGAGLSIGGVAMIFGSTIAGNATYDAGQAGGIYSAADVTIMNTTIAQNTSTAGGGGINAARGTMTIAGSTIAYNRLTGDALGAGIAAAGPEFVQGRSVPAVEVFLQDTIVAGNTGEPFFAPERGKDCNGPITSLDNNLIGDPRGCTITLLPFDKTGNAGLGTFTDDGTPGHGYVPLLATSQAIDAGNDAACLRSDQLGQSRVRACDIGAVEFQGQSQVAPLTAAITNPFNGSTISNTVPVNMAATNAQGTPTQFVLTLDNTTTLSSQSVSSGSTATYAWITNRVLDGVHTLTLAVTDGAGRTATATLSVTVANNNGGDLTPPTVAITSPSSGTWTGNSITVTATASDNVAVANIKLWANGAVFATIPCSGSTCSGTVTWVTGPLAPAAYQVNAVATDSAGNRTVSAAVTINKDAVSPVVPSGANGDNTGPALGVSITAPANGSTVTGTILVNMTATNASGMPISFSAFVDGSTIGNTGGNSSTGTLPWVTTSWSNGSHTIVATVHDAGGRTASTSVTVTVANSPNNGTDTTPPQVTITSPANGAWTGNSITVDATATDNVGVASLTFYGDGVQLGAVWTCSGTTFCGGERLWLTGSLPSGQHTITVVATDTSGNQTTSAPVVINK